MPYQPVQIVGREPVLAAGAVKLTPALNRNADADHDQRVAEQHRDQHARRAQAEEGGPEICSEIAAVQLEKPREQVNREREAVHLRRSEEHTSELQSLMRNSYAVLCLKKKKKKRNTKHESRHTKHNYNTH